MRKIQRLKREARDGVTRRGHKLKRFRTHNNALSAYAVCEVCKMGVVVNVQPLPNEIDIGGEAVALNCRKG